MAGWRFWEAPDATISKRKNKSRTSFEEDKDDDEDIEEEEEEDDEEEEEDEVEKDTDYEAPEPENTCAFQSEWQDWDEDDEEVKGDWWWRCELASQVDLKCEKDKCPFWNRNKGSHPFPQETTESDIIDEIKSRKKRNDRKKSE